MKYLLLVCPSGATEQLYYNDGYRGYLHNLTGSSNPAVIASTGVYLFNLDLKANDKFRLEGTNVNVAYIGFFAK